MSAYSAGDKFLHRFYLGNYFVARASFDVDENNYGAKASKTEIRERIFITGLARSGTTALMRKVFETGEYASLQYSNMPILLAPNMWKKRSSIESHERAHKDGIKVDGNSPEEFDEYFWKVFLKDRYITSEGLKTHEVDPAILEKYDTYISLICHSKGKDKYISKNNNNILRLPALGRLDRSKFIVLYREPVAHASSLRKLHLSFSESQKADKFILEYFNFLGHHEFGLNQKPFLFGDQPFEGSGLPKEGLDYWLASWINYYQHLLDTHADEVTVVSFEDLIASPQRVYDYMVRILDLDQGLLAEGTHTPTVYPDPECDPGLLSRARDIYDRLDGFRKY